MENNQPRAVSRGPRRDDNRERIKASIISSIDALEDDDLPRMLGLLATKIVASRRRCELDVLRMEKFHPEDVANLERHKAQVAVYTRQLAAASALLKFCNVFNAGGALADRLLDFVDS